MRLRNLGATGVLSSAATERLPPYLCSLWTKPPRTALAEGPGSEALRTFKDTGRRTW